MDTEWFYRGFHTELMIGQSVRALHDRPEMAVIAVTGAFAGLQQLLWQTAGSSKTILEAHMLYSRLSLDQFIRRTPAQYVSEETALHLATAAYERADRLVRVDKELLDRRPPVIGLGGTASVATDRVKKGKDRFHVAAKTREGVFSISADLPVGCTGGLSVRQWQGKVCDLAALNLLFYIARLPCVPVTLRGLEIVPMVTSHGDWTPPSDRQAFFARPLVKLDGQRGTTDELDPKRHLLFPGSFNPLHGGHKQMARQAERFAGLDVVCAVTGRHPDKGEIPVEELERRARQFAWMHPVLFVDFGGLYVEWARKFPGFGFVIGADSLRRMLDPTYYGGREDRDAMLEELCGLDARFYVFSRRVGDDLLTLQSVLESSDAPEAFCRRCTHLPGMWNVSSTEIRNRQPGGAP